MTSPEIERVPWSVLGPEFAVTWGRAEPGNPQPEHMQIIGMSGSGKTHFMATILQERMIVRNSPIVIVCTKPADATIMTLGWPVVDDYQDVRKHRQVIYWPRTSKLGRARKAYQEGKIYELLDRLWHPNSNTVIAFDEIAYIESLSPDIRSMIEMYWREARSQGITLIGMKQRPQGANRHMSSETTWTVAFVPKDHDDAERFAELYGNRREWLPIFDQMDPDNHEFLIRHSRSRAAYISWVDTQLRTIPPHKGEAIGTYMRGSDGQSAT